MSVVIETTLGDITVDLYLDQRPVTCLNFLKLCKMKYYNFNLFHSIRSGFIAQTGDPTAEGSGGESIFGLLEGPEKRFFSGEKLPKIRHTNTGTLAMVCTGDMMVGSQFFFTLAPDLDSLDNVHCAIGEVTEGHDVLRMLNDVICDETHRPYRDVRITHTVVLEDPFNDPPGLRAPSRSPSPNSERLKGGRIAPDEDIDEGQGKSAHEIQEIIEEKEAKARATILEIVGDLPDADIAPPENVLFVCKLNPVTTDEDLEIIFSRFGKILGCEVIRDKKTGDSLQYAFIEFDDKKSCEDAYFKMDNVLIDDRRIHVDFSQSVSRMRWMGKGKGIKYYNNNGPKEEFRENNSSRNSHNHDKKDYGNGKNEETNRRQHERRDLSSHTDKKDRDDNYGRSDRHDRHKRSDRDRSRRDRSRSRTNTDRQRSKRDKSLEKSDKDGKSKDKSREDRLRRDRSRSRDKSRHHEHKKDTSSRRDRSRSKDKTRYHEEKSRSRKDKSISKDRASENKNGGFTERERSKKDRSNSRDRSRWDRFTKDINNRSTKSSRRDRSRSRGMSKHCEDKTHDSSNSARKHRSSSKEGETNTEQMSRNNKISSQNVDSSIKRHLSPSSKYVKETKSLHCKEVYEKSTDKHNTQSFTTRYWTQLETEKKEINNSNRSFKSEKHQKSTEKIWNNTDEYVNNSEPKNTSSSKHTNKNYSDIEENYLQQREGKNTESRKHSSNELHEEPQRSPVRKSDLSKSKKSDKNDKNKDHRTPTPVTDRKGKSTKIKTKKKVKVLKKKRKQSTSSSDSSSSSSSESSSSEEDRKKKSAKHRKRKVSSSSSSSTSSSSSSSSSSESSSSSSSSDSEPSKKKRKKVVSGKVHKGKKSKNKL